MGFFRYHEAVLLQDFQFVEVQTSGFLIRVSHIKTDQGGRDLRVDEIVPSLLRSRVIIFLCGCTSSRLATVSALGMYYFMVKGSPFFDNQTVRWQGLSRFACAGPILHMRKENVQVMRKANSLQLGFTRRSHNQNCISGAGAIPALLFRCTSVGAPSGAGYTAYLLFQLHICVSAVSIYSFTASTEPHLTASINFRRSCTQY